ncbi:hypothetical protein NPIL_477651 [Nephila pilipes]|uniref:Uncharacterized protein n=1 Tax=Nephila pilipes TaxID=299642 RepID=A0A8X6PRY4_NEPPI|nr:hypothetical protein NPIL_477651 [Nephila pilipes]
MFRVGAPHRRKETNPSDQRFMDELNHSARIRFMIMGKNGIKWLVRRCGEFRREEKMAMRNPSEMKDGSSDLMAALSLIYLFFSWIVENSRLY